MRRIIRHFHAAIPRVCNKSLNDVAYGGVLWNRTPPNPALVTRHSKVTHGVDVETKRGQIR